MAKSKIIKQFASGTVPLEVALKQLKVLLAEFDKHELLTWANNELNGYTASDELPYYRKAAGNLRGTFLNLATQASRVSIPLRPDLPDSLFDYFHVVEFHESVSALRELRDKAANNPDGPLARAISGDAFPAIIKYSAVTMTAVLGAWVEVSPSVISDIIAKVENKVLDILLLLEKEFGKLDDLDIDLTNTPPDKVEKVINQINVIIDDHHIEIGDNNKISKSEIRS